MVKRDTVVSENVVKGWIKQSLTVLRFSHWPIAAGKYSQHGISDRLAISPTGVFCAFEAKRGIYRPAKKGWVHPKPSEAQQEFLNEVNAQRGFAMLVGPIEAANLELSLIAAAQSLMLPFQPGQRDKLIAKAEATRLRRLRHLAGIAERGF